MIMIQVISRIVMPIIQYAQHYVQSNSIISTNFRYPKFSKTNFVCRCNYVSAYDIWYMYITHLTHLKNCDYLFFQLPKTIGPSVKFCKSQGLGGFISSPARWVGNHLASQPSNVLRTFGRPTVASTPNGFMHNRGATHGSSNGALSSEKYTQKYYLSGFGGTKTSEANSSINLLIQIRPRQWAKMNFLSTLFKMIHRCLSPQRYRLSLPFERDRTSPPLATASPLPMWSM